MNIESIVKKLLSQIRLIKIQFSYKLKRKKNFKKSKNFSRISTFRQFKAANLKLLLIIFYDIYFSLYLTKTINKKV